LFKSLAPDHILFYDVIQHATGSPSNFPFTY
jgi:hypothetical protein